MDRNTRVLYHNSEQTLGDLLDVYGPLYVSQQLGKSVQFVVPYNTLNANARNTIRKGRPPHHLNVRTGLVKKQYKTLPLREHLFNELLPLFDEYSAHVQVAGYIITKYAKVYAQRKPKSAIVIQKYVRRWLVKSALNKALEIVAQNINIHEDVITCTPISNPVIIKGDWDAGNKYIYDADTVLQCAIMKKIPMYFYERNNQEYTVYGYEYVVNKENLVLYKSPMTRREFTFDGVEFIHNKLWYKIATNL